MKKYLLILLLMCGVQFVQAQDFTLKQGKTVSVYLSTIKEPVVQSAFEMFSEDVVKVFAGNALKAESAEKADVVLSIDKSLPREGFKYVVKKGQFRISAADAHGAAYGILELSRLIGVSPWEWWADCTPRPQKSVTFPEDYTDEQSPAVAYRGIFINDEDWGILPWADMREGGSGSGKNMKIGPDTNEKIFQLMLRLHANYYWPSMHECSTPFFTIPGNRAMAEKYGIYVGGSHCEPMGTSPATEWAKRGNGEYNYVTNRESVKQFWSNRLQEVKRQEMVYTLGMRGVHDGSMQGVKTPEEKLKCLQQVIDDQREMLRQNVNQRVEQIPQVFIPYKEVLDIYHSGLNVPEDVTLMWTDDNYGYIRHFPDDNEMMRDGGNGIYYHVSYWGRPHDYLWLGTFSPYLMRQQLTEAYMRGIDKMWVLNVGDIKPAEYLIEDFMNLAWRGFSRKTEERPQLRKFLNREFGPVFADTLASIMTEHYNLAFERKPEHMAGTRTEEADKEYWGKPRAIEGWSKQDVRTRLMRYKKISNAVESIWQAIPEERKDAYFQLVKYPVQAATQMNYRYLAHVIADEGEVWMRRSDEAYDSILTLTDIYNSNPKWNGIMDPAPRKLPVFDDHDVTSVTYPDAQKEFVLFQTDGWRSVPKSSELTYYFGDDQLPVRDAKVNLEVRLLPVHPVAGAKLAFSVSLDNATPVVVEYQTKDRSEEWKQNVLRNYALRNVTLPIVLGRSHTLVITALTEGVEVERVALK